MTDSEHLNERERHRRDARRDDLRGPAEGENSSVRSSELPNARNGDGDARRDDCNADDDPESALMPRLRSRPGRVHGCVRSERHTSGSFLGTRPGPNRPRHPPAAPLRAGRRSHVATSVSVAPELYLREIVAAGLHFWP